MANNNNIYTCFFLAVAVCPCYIFSVINIRANPLSKQINKRLTVHNNHLDHERAKRPKVSNLVNIPRAGRTGYFVNVPIWSYTWFWITIVIEQYNGPWSTSTEIYKEFPIDFNYLDNSCQLCRVLFDDINTSCMALYVYYVLTVSRDRISKYGSHSVSF